jgi:Mg2+/Co2+ transporter CorB
MESFVALLPILVLMALSFLFSGSETAMTAASQPRMIELDRQGNRRAGLIVRLREQRGRLIGALLVGNNIVNILASVLTTALFIEWFGVNGEWYATAALTVLLIIFCEVLPKTYALHAPDRTALLVAPLARLVVRALSPLAIAVEAIVRGVLRGFGVRPPAGMPPLSEEELRGVISLHRSTDSRLPDPEIEAERKMLASVLDLGDVAVGSVMTHRGAVAMIDIDRPGSAILPEVLASPFSRFPVYRGEPENIVGVLHLRDLVRHAYRRREAGERLDIAAIMVAPWFIPESTTLLDQLREFRQRHEHFALVVDEYGAFEGIVTIEDILEEIVGKMGEVAGSRHPAPGIRHAADGSYIVNGDVTIRDLNRELGWSLPDAVATTAAGLVLHEARRLPAARQVFAFHGYRFEILRREGNRIAALRIRPMALPARAGASRSGPPGAGNRAA